MQLILNFLFRSINCFLPFFLSSISVPPTSHVSPSHAERERKDARFSLPPLLPTSAPREAIIDDRWKALGNDVRFESLSSTCLRTDARALPVSWAITGRKLAAKLLVRKHPDTQASVCMVGGVEFSTSFAEKIREGKSRFGVWRLK